MALSPPTQIARFRLAGQHLTMLASMEVRGMPLTALFTPTSRGTIGAALEQMFDTPAIAELSLTSEARFTRTTAEAHMILLPLKSDLGEISRALGVLVSECRPEAAPVRFDVSTTLSRPVTGLTYLEETDRSVPEPARGLAEDQAPYSGRHPHLRLVKTDT